MRILNVNPYIDPVSGGGTAERTLQMSRFQAMQRHHVTILTMDIGIESGLPLALASVEVVVLKRINKRFLIPQISWRKLKKLVSNAEIIHLMGHWTLLNVIVYVLAQRLGIPYVVCPAGALPVFGRSRFIKFLYNGFWGERIIRKASNCISVTNKEIADFMPYGVELEKIHVIPNGIDVEGIPEPIPEMWGKLKLPDKPFILFLGRLNAIKGPDLLLKAYASCQIGFDLVYVGPDGGMLDQLERHCEEAGLQDRVHFIGSLYGEVKYQAYYAASALIVPSRKEAMSIVAIESGVTGTPVILTDQCGFDEVGDVGGGIVVSASVEGLKAGLLALEKNKDNLAAMGDRFRKYILSNFAWKMLVSRYDILYESILSMRA